MIGLALMAKQDEKGIENCQDHQGHERRIFSKQ